MKTKLIAGVIAALCISQANAYPSISISGQGLAASLAAENSLLSSLTGPYTRETFESFTAGTQQVTFNTSVGAFTQITAGSTGSCNMLGYTCNKLGILDNGRTAPDPFNGRIGIPDNRLVKNYLDSFDSREMKFTLNQYADLVGFYMTDPNDVNGSMSLSLLNGNTVVIPYANIFNGALPDGRMFYVSLYDASGISSITFKANAIKDGYGIDNVTVAAVPEPGSLALLGLGLIGLGFARRQAKA